MKNDLRWVAFLPHDKKQFRTAQQCMRFVRRNPVWRFEVRKVWRDGAFRAIEIFDPQTLVRFIKGKRKDFHYSDAVGSKR